MAEYTAMQEKRLAVHTRQLHALRNMAHDEACRASTLMEQTSLDAVAVETAGLTVYELRGMLAVALRYCRPELPGV